MADSLNHYTKNRLAGLTTHIPNPVDFSAISNVVNDEHDNLPAFPDDTQLIAWCGRLAPVKSPLRAIDTLDKLIRDGNDRVHLVMMGEGQMHEDIVAYADGKGLLPHLTLTGRIAEPTAVMKRCRVGLMTSDVEGFPNVILEMLAAGIPRVVTTDCAGGLDRIPGVIVAGEKTAESLAIDLSDAMHQPKQNEQIDIFLQERSPGAFFQKILTV